MTAATQALNAALLHFIWQGALIALLLWITLTALRNRSANARYMASCAVLALMAALPVITAWMLYQRPASIAISYTISTAVPAAVQIARQSAPLAWIRLLSQWTLPVWSVGVLIFALRLAIGCRQVTALRRLGHAAEGRIAETVATLARRMKTRRAIRVLVSTVAESPSVVGWLRPVILLPAAALAGLEPEQLQAVLAHEIAHIRRHDYLVNLAQTMVETLLFYHPAVWWVSARLRHERELCCDDAAVAACGDAISYARALTTLERLRVTTPRLAIGSTGGSLLFRIQRLAGVKQELGPSKLPGMAALALGLACFAITVHWAKAQQTMQQQQMPEEWGIVVSSTGQVLHRNRVPYPEATSKDGIQGTVILDATLDQAGNVADVRVLSGPPALRKTALQAVLQWQFATGHTGETQQVSIAFHQDERAKTEQQRGEDQRRLSELLLQQQGKEMQQLSRMGQQLVEARSALGDSHPDSAGLLQERSNLLGELVALNEQITNLKEANQERLQLRAGGDSKLPQLEAEYSLLMIQLGRLRQVLTEQHPQVIALMDQIESLRKQIGASPSSLVGSPLARIEVSGVPDNERDELAARLTIHIGGILSQVQMDRAIAAIRQLDDHLECRFQTDGNGDTVLRITGPGNERRLP